MNNIGNKANNLLWLKENNIPVAEFVILKPEDVIVDYNKIRDNILNNIKKTNLDISKFIDCFTWKEENIKKYLKFTDKEVAFRTSSSLEDGSEYSFAGLYRTFLNVPLTEHNFKKYVSLCIKSLFSNLVISYLEQNNLSAKNLDCSIIIQEMFYSNYSGVAFIYERDSDSKLVYNEGLCKNIVDGGDAYSLKLNNLSDDFKKIKKYKELLDCFKKIYRLKGFPQDIEWGISNHSFCILQTRNITRDFSNNKLKLETYDCTNISESYPGITVPLTYSFINSLYSKVYISFFSMFGIKNIEKHKDVFDNLLGYINGRVYYKIDNWYNFLKILPGYRYNKEFFEAMLVPKKKIKTEKEKKFKGLFIRNLLIIIKFGFKLFFYKKDHQNFLNKFNYKYEQHKKKNLKQLSNDEIFSYYEKTRDSFLDDWKIPIMNDFRLMIFHGLLGKFYNKKEQATSKELNGIMSGFAKDQYFEIIKELSNLSSIVNQDKEVMDIFCQSDNKEIYNNILNSKNPKVKDFKDKLYFYLNNFYYRRPGELKLESEDINDNPEIIINLIKNYPKEIEEKKQIVKFNNPIIKTIANKTKDAIKNREIFRAKRAIVFGVAKECFMQIAFNFKNSGVIEKKEDIFFLNIEEIKSIINRGTIETDYRDLIKKRQAKIEQYKSMILPDRIIICDYGDKTVIFDDTIEVTDSLTGLPVSDGIVRGRTLVLEKFEVDVDYKDKILITYQTDPGWSIIFPLLKGVILERGNALSHASILSREMGIPSIVKVSNAVSIFKNNQLIELNGNNGEIKIIKE